MNHASAWRSVLDATSATWIKSQKRRVTYSELAERTRKFAGVAHDRNLHLGDRIVIATSDDEEAALLFAATVLNGLTAVVIDPDASGDRSAALIRQAEPSLILVDMALAEKWALSGDPRLIPIIETAPMKGLLSQLRRKADAEGLAAALEQAANRDPPAEIPPETLAYILFTSGTTNQPKGVCISHRALFDHLATLSRIYALEQSSVVLNTLMLSHADGMIQGPMLTLVNSALLLRPLKFEVSAISALLDVVYRARVTHMVAVPTMLSLMVKLADDDEDAFRGGDFKLMISCGAALDAWLWEAVESKLGAPVINVYGLTETVAGGIFGGAAVGAGGPGSIGSPIDCEARIIGADGAPVGVGETGELLMRGSLLMSGYFNAPDLTREVLDDDGWLHTGDLAVLGEDGVLSITGRKKNIVIRGGYNIQPEEVAEVLGQHPAVIDAIAFGMPDPDWGERLVAVVGSAAASEKELLEFSSQRLEPRKVPSRILIVDQLPKGRSGKPSLPEARALFAEREATRIEATVDGNGDAKDRLFSIAERCFRTNRISLSLASSPDDLLAWDSMAHMEFVMSLEQEFGLQLSPREVMSIDRLDKALALVTRE